MDLHFENDFIINNVEEDEPIIDLDAIGLEDEEENFGLPAEIQAPIVEPNDDPINEPEMFNEEAENLFQLLQRRENHQFEFIFTKTKTVRTRQKFDRMNPTLLNIFLQKYPNKSLNQVYTYTKKRVLNILYNGNHISNYFINPNFTLEDLNRFLEEKEYFLHDLSLVSEVNNNQVIIGYQTLGHSNQAINHVGDEYGETLQKLLNNVYRSQTREIAEVHKELLIAHINIFPNDLTTYLINFTNDSNQLRRSHYITLSFQQRNNVINLIRQAWSEEQNNDNIASNQIANINMTHVIDATVVRRGQRRQGRRNQAAGLFNYYYDGFENQVGVMNIFKKCQIYTLQELNDKKNLKEINMHCILNALKFFFTETEDLKRDFARMYIFLLKLISRDIYTPKKVFVRLSAVMNESIGLYEVDEKQDLRGRYTLYNRGESLIVCKRDLENVRIKIGIIKNHAFPIFRVNCNPIIIKLLKQIPTFDKDLSLINEVYDSVNGLAIKRRKDINLQTDSFRLVKEMFNHNLFTELPVDKIKDIIKSKQLAQAYLENSSFMLTKNILQQDLKSNKIISPSNTYIQKPTNELSDNIKKVIKTMTKLGEKEAALMYKDIIANLVNVKDVNEENYIGFADVETYEKTYTLRKGKEVITKNYISPYSIDYVFTKEKTFLRYTEEDDDLNKKKIYVNNSWGTIKRYRVKDEDIKDGCITYKNKLYKVLQNGNNVKYIEDRDDDCIEKFIKEVYYVGSKKATVTICFHNMKFDNAAFTNVKDLILKSKIEKNGNLYKVVYSYFGKKIVFVDTYKMIAERLSNFSKMFNLQTTKDYLPYKIYTEENVVKEILSRKELDEAFKGKDIQGKTSTEFIKHIIENKVKDVLFNAEQKETFKINEVNFINIKKYSQFYSGKDVELLMKGYISFGRQLQKIKYNPIFVLDPTMNLLKTFAKWRKQDFSMTEQRFVKNKLTPYIVKHLKLDEERGFNILSFLTSSSFSDNFLIYNDCYKDVYDTVGTVKDFVMESVYGGHTMTAENKVQIHHSPEIKTTPSKEYIEDMERINKQDSKAVREFLLKHHKNDLSDYDATSCYPASMQQMDGFIQGKPTELTTEQIKDLNKINDFHNQCDYISQIESFSEQTHFFLRVKFTSKGSISLFPLFKVKLTDLENGVRTTERNNYQWENEIPKEGMVVDKYMLTCILETHNLTARDYIIEQGIYYQEGYNTTIKDIIGEMKASRDKYKKEKNPLQLVYKMMMNASYGKTLQKSTDKKSTFFVGTSDEMYDALLKSNDSMSVTVHSKNVNDENQNVYEFEKKEVDVFHTNRSHIGSSILGFSKMLMSKPKIIADVIYRFSKDIPAHNRTEEKIYKYLENYLKDKTEEEIEIFKKDSPLKYTDTDSMMGKFEYIYLIMNIYEEVYKEKLDGTEFGQFHIDFVMSNPKLVNVFAKRAIFLNKKEYAMILQGYNPETKEFEYEEKIAFKGVPLHRIEYLAKQSFPNEEFPLFTFFSSDKKDYKVDVVGEDGFKVSYSNKGSLAESVHSAIKVVNTKQYSKTYHRFLLNK